MPAARSGHSPTPEVISESLIGGRSRLEALARGTDLRHQSMGLSLGWLPRPWLQAVRPIALPLSSLLCPSEWL
jgi:hypothetical protein